MKIYLTVQNTRVVQLSYLRNTPEEIELDVPEDHEIIKNPFVYVIVDGQPVKDDEYQDYLINRPQDKSELEQVKEENAALKQQMIQQNIDMQEFMDYILQALGK
ncbi:hypothetical protein RAH41_08205 [Gottfriedia acidiceleris]|uniref:hypothetical protein n=1 Tax=Gottfriedia acidiceleris TaxID=371036 RepID=UPI002F261FB7